MSVFSITMPPEIHLDSEAEFDFDVWQKFKVESQEIALRIAEEFASEPLCREFFVVPVTQDNLHILPEVDKLLEKEFPKHGGAAHFLLSTLPIAGLYNPVTQDHLFHNCVQYVAFIEKKSGCCVATCGLYLTEKEHVDVVGGGWLVLAEQYRKRGLGRAIVDYAIEFYRSFAEEHGQTKLHIVTTDEPHVQAARKIYEAYGAYEIGRSPHPESPDHNVLILEWELFVEGGKKRVSA